MILDETAYALTNAFCDGVELLFLGAAEQPELRLPSICHFPLFYLLIFFSARYISFASDSQVLIRMLRTTLPSAVMNRRNCDALQDTPHSVYM